MAVGDHLNAAEIFLDIARRAVDIGIVYPAPMLFLQAAHAYLFGEAYPQSIEQARAGLEMLAGQERWAGLKREGERYINELDAAGQKDEAQILRTWFDEALEGKELKPTTPQGQLPEKCPYCGASMSLESINAAGGRAAECQYCGSVILPRNEE
jgi:DNA-directed RNA polymerase subunit RPC12/RpoP